MGGKSKPATTTQNSTTTTTPYDASALNNLFGLATSAQAKVDALPDYTGPNANQQAGINALSNAAVGMDTGVDELRALALKQLNGDFLDPTKNQYVQGMVDSLNKQTREQALKIGDAANLAGAYGGSRQGVLEGQAIGDLADTVNNLYYTNYNAERQLQQNSGNLLTTANDLAIQPGVTLGKAGDAEMTYNTAAKEDAYSGLDKLASILSMMNGYGTTTQSGTTTSTAAKASGLQSGLSGALGGASAGSSFGPWGAGIGAVLGGLGGLFG